MFSHLSLIFQIQRIYSKNLYETYILSLSFYLKDIKSTNHLDSHVISPLHDVARSLPFINSYCKTIVFKLFYALSIVAKNRGYAVSKAPSQMGKIPIVSPETSTVRNSEWIKSDFVCLVNIPISSLKYHRILALVVLGD